MTLPWLCYPENISGSKHQIGLILFAILFSMPVYLSLSLSFTTYLPSHLSAKLPNYLPVYLSIYLPICLIYISVDLLPTHRYIYFPFNLPPYLCTCKPPYLSMSISLIIYLSYTPMYLFVCPCVYISMLVYIIKSCRTSLQEIQPSMDLRIHYLQF